MTEALMLHLRIPEWVEIDGDDTRGWYLLVAPTDARRLAEWLAEADAIARAITVRETS